MKNKQILIDKFNSLNLNYLDYHGYNEIEQHDSTETLHLYFDMFNTFVQPIFNELEKEKFNNDEIIFNFFIKDCGKINMEFYQPYISFEINEDVKNIVDKILKEEIKETNETKNQKSFTIKVKATHVINQEWELNITKLSNGEYSYIDILGEKLTFKTIEELIKYVDEYDQLSRERYTDNQESSNYVYKDKHANWKSLI